MVLAYQRVSLSAVDFYATDKLAATIYSWNLRTSEITVSNEALLIRSKRRKTSMEALGA